MLYTCIMFLKLLKFLLMAIVFSCCRVLKTGKKQDVVYFEGIALAVSFLKRIYSLKTNK